MLRLTFGAIKDGTHIQSVAKFQLKYVLIFDSSLPWFCCPNCQKFLISPRRANDSGKLWIHVWIIYIHKNLFHHFEFVLFSRLKLLDFLELWGNFIFIKTIPMAVLSFEFAQCLFKP